MSPGMKLTAIGGFIFVTAIMVFLLDWFDVPMTLYIPYIYWGIALLVFLLILPSNKQSVFDELT